MCTSLLVWWFRWGKRSRWWSRTGSSNRLGMCRSSSGQRSPGICRSGKRCTPQKCTFRWGRWCNCSRRWTPARRDRQNTQSPSSSTPSLQHKSSCTNPTPMMRFSLLDKWCSSMSQMKNTFQQSNRSTAQRKCTQCLFRIAQMGS